MGKLLLTEEGVPTTPASGIGRLYLDNVLPGLFVKDDAGRVWGRSHRASVAAQGAGFATDTYLTDSGLLVGSFGVQVRTLFEWIICASKTAAGTATPIIQVRIGVNQTTGDTSRLTLTGPAQTAATDIGILSVLVVVRTVAASGVIEGHMSWSHGAPATGFCNNDAGGVNGTSAGFDNSALSGNYVGLSINGGTAAAWTVTQVRAQSIW